MSHSIHASLRFSRGKKALAALVALPLALALAACTVPESLDLDPKTVPTTPTAEPSPSPSPEVTGAPANSPTPSPSPTPSETAEDDPATASGTALAAALELTVKGRAPKTGYDRDEFGSGWVDVDRNGCDTRNDMLKLRLINLDMSGNCKVMAGDLLDPFTGEWIHFERGGPSEVDIDHLVALSDAWQKGAAQWEFAKRVAFANDPLNLEPVDSGQNRSKGDGDAATWLPPNKDFRCQYVARQVAVKTKYEVWATQAEVDAIVGILEDCPGEPLPDAGSQPVIADNTGPEPKAKEEPAVQDTPSADNELDERYAYCKDLPAGLGPYVKGVDPEYEWYRDGDGDGTVCE